MSGDSELSPELRAPESLALDAAELREQYLRVAGQRIAASPGHGCSDQVRTCRLCVSFL